MLRMLTQHFYPYVKTTNEPHWDGLQVDRAQTTSRDGPSMVRMWLILWPAWFVSSVHKEVPVYFTFYFMAKELEPCCPCEAAIPCHFTTKKSGKNYLMAALNTSKNKKSATGNNITVVIYAVYMYAFHPCQTLSWESEALCWVWQLSFFQLSLKFYYLLSLFFIHNQVIALCEQFWLTWSIIQYYTAGH